MGQGSLLNWTSALTLPREMGKPLRVNLLRKWDTGSSLSTVNWSAGWPHPSERVITERINTDRGRKAGIRGEIR